jgi:hypothetical protein
MHATLAYLNAAGSRMAGSDSGNCAFMQVMDSLLANIHGVSHAGNASKTHSKPPRQAKSRKARSLLRRLGYFERA